jgi:RNA polymerase sigma-70 factor (ECF subfamily)
VLTTDQRSAAEEAVRQHCDAADYAAAATRAIEAYGPEILGYLVAVLRDDTDAHDSFSMFCEDLWQGLPGFRWEASLRTWSYTLARNAMSRMLRDPHRRADRRVPISETPVYDVAMKVRTQTLKYLRTEVKDAIAELRSELDPEAQTLFILRINRKMSWTEIARIMAEDDDADADEETLKKLSARLRKRFERAKDELKKKARERGLA